MPHKCPKPSLVAFPITLGALVLLEAVPGGSPSAAYAQSQPLETVVVTARRTAENLRDVPATVNVLTESTIEDAGVETLEDLVNLTPGVTVVTNTAEPGDTQVNIRGINGARDGESAVALVVDGILKTNTAVLAQNQGDVTQIEVLKGPQGAYYGRNAAAGALVMTTRKPGEEISVRGELIGANDSTFSGFVSASGPLSDSVGGLISLDYGESDGFYRNVGPYPEANGATIDPSETYVVSGRLIFDLNESSTLDLKARLSDLEAGSIRYNTVFNLPNAAAALGAPGFSEDPDDRPPLFESNIPSKSWQETTELSARLESDMGWGTLTAWGLYSDVEQDFTVDGAVAAFGFFNAAPECRDSVADLFAAGYTLNAPLALGPVPEASTLGAFSVAACDGTQYQRRDQEDLSLEFELASDSDGAFNWSLGGYYLTLEREVSVAIGYDRGQGVLRNELNGPDTINPTEQLAWDRFDTDVYAIFGSAEFDLSDALTVSLALRYDREEREVSNKVDPQARNQYLRGGGTPLNVGLDAGPILDQAETFSQVQPKVSIAWVPSEQVTMFANWGIGFKSGGFNNSGSRATIEGTFNSPLIDSNLNIPDQFEKETSSAFEVGTKALFMDGRLTLDAAAYYTDIDDMQFFEFFAGPFGILRVVSNIDETEVYGVEAAFSFAATDRWTVFGSANANDSEIKANSARPGTQGGKSPYTSDYTANLGTQLSFPLGGDMEFTLRADYRVVGPTWFSTVQNNDVPTQNVFLFLNFGFDVPTSQLLGTGNFANTQRERYEVLNLRATLRSDNWRITAFANNALDEEFLAEVIPAPEFGGSFFSPGAQARYGLEVGFDF